jgi:hypothetical protein
MMIRYQTLLGVVAGFCTVTAGCGGAVFQDDISAGNALWSRSKITTYSYTVVPNGFMLPQKYTVDVRSDGTSTVTPVGDTPPPGQPPVFKSMNSLYAHIKDIRKAGGIVRVTFDPTDGHITECFVDPYKQIADDEVQYVISDFRSKLP